MQDDVMVPKNWFSIALLTVVGLVVVLATFGISVLTLLRPPAFADREDY